MSEDDLHLLETQGMQRVWVTELEEGEVGEDEAAMLAYSNPSSTLAGSRS